MIEIVSVKNWKSFSLLSRDAQKLEVFYNRNQQLKEQNKALQDTISLLEERSPPSLPTCQELLN